MIPLLSSSASTSSGTRPFTRTAYIPRTYFAIWIRKRILSDRYSSSMHIGWNVVQERRGDAQDGSGVKEGKERRRLTCPLPPRHPARLGVDHRDDTVEIGRRADLNTIRRAFHLPTHQEHEYNNTPHDGQVKHRAKSTYNDRISALVRYSLRE